ncbi:MAG: DUF2064 domain-containing protein [Bryobacter sp.]|nr:DUF2064 domain-containing protein [Bryobacter sp.]
MTHRSLLLFTKSPQAEALAKRLPFAESCALFQQFLQAWVRRAEAVGATVRVLCPEDSLAALGHLLPGVSLRAQQGDSFAQRLQHAFAQSFAEGAGTVLLVGGDTAPPNAAALAEAFAHLEQEAPASVLGPSLDGGVFLIGANHLPSALLANIPWHTPEVGIALRRNAAVLGLHVLSLLPRPDVDCRADLAAYCQELAQLNPSSRSPRSNRRRLLPVRAPPRLS